MELSTQRNTCPPHNLASHGRNQRDMKQRTLAQLYKWRVCPEALGISWWHPGHPTFTAAVSRVGHGKTNVNVSATATVFPPDSQQVPICSPEEWPPPQSLQGLQKNLLPNESSTLPLPHDYLPGAAPAAGPELRHKVCTWGNMPRLCLPPPLQAIICTPSVSHCTLGTSIHMLYSYVYMSYSQRRYTA